MVSSSPPARRPVKSPARARKPERSASSSGASDDAAPDVQQPPPVEPPPADAPLPSSGSFGTFLYGQLGFMDIDPISTDPSKEAMMQREGVYNFLQVPWNVEPLMCFG